MTDLEKIEDWIERNIYHDIFEDSQGTATIPRIIVSDLLAFIQSLKPKKEKLDFTGIHNKLQSRMKELTGKPQILGFGGVYFIPTEKELEVAFKRYLKDYPKLNNRQTIVNILLRHIEECCKNHNFAPAIKYFIYKDKSSRLANSYLNLENEINNKIEIIEPNINTKDLF